MKLEDYFCKNCDNEFEYLKMKKYEKIKCPKCESTELGKKFNALGYQINGDNSASTSPKFRGKQ